MQTALRMIFPSQCLSCSAEVDEDFALCGSCWSQTPFVQGLTCLKCCEPLLGDRSESGDLCDQCLRIARPWSRGFAALFYRENARRIVLALKHGDRTDLARPAAKWMAVTLPELPPETVVIPVPLHWRRFIERRYNQAALLAKLVARQKSLSYLPDALFRQKKTAKLDGMTRDARFDEIAASIVANPKRVAMIKDAPVLLVDDVMTSGATLSAATDACLSAGANHIDVLVLARVSKDL